MDPELKRLLQETRALAAENLQVSKALRRAQIWGFLGKLVIWAIVLLLPLYLYQTYLMPIVSKFAPSTSSPGIFGVPSSAELQKLIDSYTGN
jgi:hypothetical protein